jgi:flagellar hook-associated protein 2
VTFQLLASDVGSSVQVQIANDDSSVMTAVSSVVTAYNKVVADLTTQEGKDSSGNPEPLYGSPALSLIQSQLSQALLGGSASGSISNIGQLGISVNNDGTLSLDTDTLQGVLDSNYSDVTGFLQNSGSFGQNLSTVLNNLGNQAPNGEIYLTLQANSANETDLNTSITNENARIAADKVSLTTELNSANEILQSIPSQLNEVNELYSAITGYNQSQNG